MSREKIKGVAIEQFNRYGYEGVKMAQVAEEAGIRKQSIAYHFPSKKALLIELYEEVIEAEISFVREHFRQSAGASWEDRLHGFMIEHKNRFLTKPNVHFMFVLSFMAPIEVNDFLLTQYRRYLTALKQEVTELFADAAIGGMTPEAYTVAYVTLLDGLDVQLVYETRQAYEQTMTITWKLFLAGIRHVDAE